MRGSLKQVIQLLKRVGLGACAGGAVSIAEVIAVVVTLLVDHSLRLRFPAGVVRRSVVMGAISAAMQISMTGRAFVANGGLGIGA